MKSIVLFVALLCSLFRVEAAPFQLNDPQFVGDLAARAATNATVGFVIPQLANLVVGYDMRTNANGSLYDVTGNGNSALVNLGHPCVTNWTDTNGVTLPVCVVAHQYDGSPSNYVFTASVTNFLMQLTNGDTMGSMAYEMLAPTNNYVTFDGGPIAYLGTYGGTTAIGPQVQNFTGTWGCQMPTHTSLGFPSVTYTASVGKSSSHTMPINRFFWMVVTWDTHLQVWSIWLDGDYLQNYSTTALTQNNGNITAMKSLTIFGDHGNVCGARIYVWKTQLSSNDIVTLASQH